MKKLKIDYLGKTFETETFVDASDDICQKIANRYKEKPPLNIVYSEIQSIVNGKTSISNINKFFFKDIQNDVVLHHSKWSINEVLGCNDLIRNILGKIKKSPHIYNSKRIENNVDAVFRIGSKGVTSKPANFKIKVVKDILEKYNTNNNYYDFSCGWGVRMMGSIVSGVNYFGTDPNTKLFPKLIELYDEFKKRKSNCPKVDIRCQGSEVFVPEWENIIGVAFSSPPYFSLEDYKHGDQSVKKDTDYNDWLSLYYEKTIQNIYKYLVKDGHLIININNFKNFDLVGDTKKLCIKNGFKLVETETYQNASRKKSNNTGMTENNEGMYVFIKL